MQTGGGIFKHYNIDLLIWINRTNFGLGFLTLKEPGWPLRLGWGGVILFFIPRHPPITKHMILKIILSCLRPPQNWNTNPESWFYFLREDQSRESNHGNLWDWTHEAAKREFMILVQGRQTGVSASIALPESIALPVYASHCDSDSTGSDALPNQWTKITK